MTPLILFEMMMCAYALPTDIAKSEPRSLFHDVINSIKIRSQISEDAAKTNENAVFQQYDFNQDDKNLIPFLPTDFQFLPRRNDRIELPTLRHRLPKSQLDKTEITKEEKKEEVKPDDKKDEPHEIVISIDTQKYSTKASTSTTKPKKNSTKRTRPSLKDKSKTAGKNSTHDDDIISDEAEGPDTSSDWPMPHRPQNNNMSGQSQIGNRESQMVIKPTVIVNFRGSVTNKDSDIRLEGRDNEENAQPVPNVFNINQDVHIEKTYAIVDQVNSDNKVKTENFTTKHETKITDFIKNEFLNESSTEKSENKDGVKIDYNTEVPTIEVNENNNRSSRVLTKEDVSIAFTVETNNGKQLPLLFRII